jgi:hypothetical protein
MLRGITRRPAARRSCLSRSRRALGPVALGCAALLLTAGCGQAKSAAATAPSSSSSAGSSMTAYLTCLRQHGVNVPALRPSVRPTARPTSGFGAGSATMQKAQPASPPASGAPRAGRFLNGLNPSDPKAAAALKACQSKLPTFPRPSASPSAA